MAEGDAAAFGGGGAVACAAIAESKDGVSEGVEQAGGEGWDGGGCCFDLTEDVAGEGGMLRGKVEGGGVDEENEDGGKGEGEEVYGLAQLGVAWGKEDLVCDGYKTGERGLGGKMEVLLQIMVESRRSGEKILVFSQSVATLNRCEKFDRKPGLGHFVVQRSGQVDHFCDAGY